MQTRQRIEAALERAFDGLKTTSTPPSLRAAMRDAVFPGGARLRPGLCLAVADACGGDVSTLGAAEVAAGIELLHCASLVHDDLPCFDDAPMRRGRPSVQAKHGEELAVLAGDGLIVMAFETVASAPVEAMLVPRLVRILAQGVGARGGLVAGQAWESETRVPLRAYHQSKTGALFEAASSLGAALAGDSTDAWASFGAALGEAYQVADDLSDLLGDVDALGKPAHQDSMHERPNAALSLGVKGAMRRLETLIDGAIELIPDCEEPTRVVAWMERFGARLLPSKPAHVAASDRADRASDRASRTDRFVALLPR